MGWFGPTRPLGKDELNWQLAGFQWLLREFGGLEAHRSSTLVNADGEYFADSKARGHERAEQILAEVKTLMGITDWPTRLVGFSGQRKPFHVNEHIIVNPEGVGAAGTFQLLEDGAGGWIAEIRYDEGLLDDPHALVATFAHELSHYLLSYARHSFPGGDDCHELLTDLTAVFFGFGIFLACSARHYSVQQTENLGHMWRSQSQGYLSERGLVTAMAISETLAGRDPDDARSYLKAYLKKDLDIAMKWCAKRDIHADVTAIELDAYGVEQYPAVPL